MSPFGDFSLLFIVETYCTAEREPAAVPVKA